MSTASGVRSSWLASSTSLRCTRADCSSRSSIASNAAASARASAVPCALPTRSARSEAPIRSAAARTRSNGRTARPDHHHASAAVTGSSSATVSTAHAVGSTPVRVTVRATPSAPVSVTSSWLIEVTAKTRTTGR